MQLQELAKVIRSKNAGPRCLTLDVMFAHDRDYRRVVESGAVRPETISRLYGISAGQIAVINYPLGRAIKIVLPRSLTAGDPGDRDVYGAQQHARLLEIEV